MDYRSSEIKAGFLIFMGFLVLAVFVFFLGDVKNLLKDKKELMIVFDYTSGLASGATVRYAGLDVGRVKSIGLNRGQDDASDQIAVMTEIDPKIRIRSDAIATIKTEGLMGAFYIDIRPGKRKGELLDVGAPLNGTESFDFAKVGDMMGEVVMQAKRFADASESLIDETQKTLEKVRGSLENVDHVFVNNETVLHQTLTHLNKITLSLSKALEEDEGALKNSLVNLNSITRDLSHILKQRKEDINLGIKSAKSIVVKTDQILTRKQENLENILSRTDRLTHELEALLHDNRPSMTKLIHNLEADSEKIGHHLDSAALSMDETLKQSNAILVENRRNLFETLKNMKETSVNLKSLTEDVKRNPWKLIRKSDEVLVEESAIGKTTKQAPFMRRLDKVPND